MDRHQELTCAGAEERVLECRVVEDIDRIPAAQWDLLAGADNPFLSHAFLSALERNGCVGADSGWWPHHLTLYDGERLLGAMPAYLKEHSYGEFVFDWAWADAYERAGLSYYPKLLCAVPFTPVTGPRLLVAPGAERERVVRGLIGASLQLATEAELSSAHWLFTDDTDTAALESLPLLRRWGCQFHWYNRGYRDFQDYLDSLSSKRRKQVRKERREAAAAPVAVEVKHGDELTEGELVAYHRLYAATYDRKWGYPSLTLDYFLDVAERMPRALVVVLARRGRRHVAGAHLFRGRRVLFGRNWGRSEHHRCLHFELCYYRGIEYCIAEGLAGFEAGAQGEHKLTRGFMPVRTCSFHWIRDRRFRSAVEEFLERERAGTAAYIAEAEAHSPFRNAPGPDAPGPRYNAHPG